MRVSLDPQFRFGSTPIDEVELNVGCRDEIIPILRALQHIYANAALREKIMALIGSDVNGSCSARHGRTGMSYWVILVLAAVRLGCNLNYDKLQDLAENHLTLRLIMGVEGWDNKEQFDWRRVSDNLHKLQPETIEQINHAIVSAGHELVPDAAARVRGDAFVCKTNIHYPTDSSLIGDGIRCVILLAVELAALLGEGGWRQHQHLHRQVRKLSAGYHVHVDGRRVHDYSLDGVPCAPAEVQRRRHGRPRTPRSARPG